MYGRRCSFVIPAYNEARRLPATLDAIAGMSAPSLDVFEIVVVDDGSTDSTAEVAKAFHAPSCRVRVVRVPHRGKGYAIRRGVLMSRGEIIVLCDADLSDSAREVVHLEAALERGADLAIGSRWVTHNEYRLCQPFYRRLSSRFFNLLTFGLMALPFKDTQCGLKALTRRAANSIFPLLSLDGWGYDIEMIHVALEHGLRVEEVDLRIHHDYRNSHFRPIADGWATFWDLLRVHRNHLDGAYGKRAIRPYLEQIARPSVDLQLLGSASDPDSEAPENAA